MLDLLLESNVRHENEENIFYSMTMRKRKDSSIHRTKNEIFDNETKFVFRQRTSLLQFGWMSDEQDNEKLFNENRRIL